MKTIMAVVMMVAAMAGCAALPAAPSLDEQKAQAQALVDAVAAAKAALAETQGQLAEVKAEAVAASQPAAPAASQPVAPVAVQAVTGASGGDIARNGDATGVIKAVDQAQAVASAAEKQAAAFEVIMAKYQASLNSSQNQQQAMLATLAAAGSVVKTISPQTTPYVDLAAIGVGLIIGLAGVFKGHATAVSAITTPGTTDGPVTSAPVAAGAAAAGTNAVASRN